MKHKASHLDHKSGHAAKELHSHRHAEHHMVEQHEMGGRDAMEEKVPMPKAPGMNTGDHHGAGKVPPTPEMMKGSNFPMAKAHEKD